MAGSAKNILLMGVHGQRHGRILKVKIVKGRSCKLTQRFGPAKKIYNIEVVCYSSGRKIIIIWCVIHHAVA